jgi:hypothetical protein
MRAAMVAISARWHPLAHMTVTPRCAAVAVAGVAPVAEAEAPLEDARRSGAS